MSNPIEQKRLKSEAKWEKERAKDAKRKEKKSSFLRAEENVEAVKKEEAVKRRRAEIGSTPLGVIQRDFVDFLKQAHRSVTLEEASESIKHDVASSEDLIESLKNHPRVEVVGKLYKYKPRYAVSNIDEMLELIDRNEEGIIAKELFQSYYEAEKDVETLKNEGKIMAIPNKKLYQSDILFGCGKSIHYSSLHDISNKRTRDEIRCSNGSGIERRVA